MSDTALNNISELQIYLNTDSRFVKQDDGGGRRWFYMVQGEKVAYIWFKWALGGWRLAFYKESENENWETRGVVESVEKLNSIINGKHT